MRVFLLYLTALQLHVGAKVGPDLVYDYLYSHGEAHLHCFLVSVPHNLDLDCGTTLKLEHPRMVNLNLVLITLKKHQV